MSEFWLILGMFLITFSIRFAMFAFAGKMQFPTWLVRALKFVPPAVLTAIIVPSVVMPAGSIDISFNNVYLLAGAFSVLVALISKSLLKTIALGMAFFLFLQWLTL